MNGRPSIFVSMMTTVRTRLLHNDVSTRMTLVRKGLHSTYFNICRPCQCKGLQGHLARYICRVEFRAITDSKAFEDLYTGVPEVRLAQMLLDDARK